VRYASRVRFALLLLAACSQAPTLTIGVATNPLAFAFRPDGGDWQQATELSRSELQAIYEIPDASGTIAIACTQPNGAVQVEELSANESELASELYGPLPWPQLACTKPLRASTEVVGSMLQAGTVYIGDEAVTGDGEWQFNASANPGVHDVVALSTSNVVLITHDVTMIEPTTLPTIDLDDGVDVEAFSLVPPDNANFALQCPTSVLDTVHGTHVVASNSSFFIPSDQLETGDVDYISVIAFTGDLNLQMQSFLFPSSNLGISVIEPLELPTGEIFSSDSVSVDLDNVVFPQLPTDIRVVYNTQAVSLAITETSNWFFDHSPTTSVTFDESFPGFAWPLVPIAAQREFMLAQRSSVLVNQSATFDPPVTTFPSCD
jgi:hypothetical protein